MHKIVILGPQGSGKGTQATLLSKQLDVPALSMGELLREEKASGSELGKQIASFMDVGALVPDDVTTAVLQKQLNGEDMQGGFIIDGFPRFMEQYESSKSFFQPTAVIVLDVSEEESMKRILQRAKEEDRADDTPEAIQKRLTWSREQTQPVIDEYRKAGIVHEIDGMGTIEEIAQRIENALNL